MPAPAVIAAREKPGRRRGGMRMKRRWIAAVICAAALCVAAAGCGSEQEAVPEQGAAAATTSAAWAETAAAAETAATAATAAEAAAEEEMDVWQEEDDAYLTGITASEYVELPEKYGKLVIEAAKPVDPTDEEVDARIQIELENRTVVEESKHVHVREGFIVNIDYVGRIDGEEFEGGSGNYDLTIGSGSFIEGFESGLIGVKKGETVDLNLTFPENYYPERGLAGRDVVFTVTVNKISEKVTPKLNDEFARSLNLTNAFGQAVTTVEDYREYIRSNIIEEREAEYENTVKSQIVAALVQESTFTQDPPAHMIDKYNYLLTRQLNYYALQSYTDLQTLMTAYYGATEENYLDIIRDMAGNYARQGIAFQAVADKEGLNPNEDAVSTHVAEYVAMDAAVEKPEELDRVIRESLRDELMTDNVIDWLYKRCRVEEPKAPEEASTDQTAAAAEAATGEAAEAADEGMTAAAAQASTDEAAEASDEDMTAAAAEKADEAGASDTSEESGKESGEEADAARDGGEKEAVAENSGGAGRNGGESGIVLDGKDDTAARHEN